jgi:phenylalanyl-tRNA synthetase beta chain
MHISLSWIKDFVELPKNLDPKDLANMLTLKTAEVEGVTSEGENFEKMVIGQVIELKPHPNADKLKLAITSIGKETHQIVCGGINLKEGMYVAVALPGAKVKWHGEGEPVELKPTKIRGEESYGMICASNEIGLKNEKEGPQDICDLSSIKPIAGTPLSEIFKESDTVLEFDNKSLTHRPDLWGHYGIAREIASITGSKFKPLNPNPKIPNKGESVKVEIKDEKLCTRYCGLIINNIKVQDSPKWLKARLKATDHGIHNNIVDVTNYVMTELGQPMHAFDKNYIKKGIIVRRAKENEKIKTLDKKERKLDSETLVITDHEKPVAIAGIMGGENSEINLKTTSIILESATFNASSVRKSSVKLGVRTESVQRFEKSLDPNLAELAIKRAAELILEICPTAEIAGPITDIHKSSQKEAFNLPQVKIDLDIKKACSKIGIEIPAKEVKKILESLEFEIKEKKKDIFEVTVPSFRSSKDVLIEDDLIEEIARIYGYETIPTSLPNLPTKLPKENEERFKKHKARELFSFGLGYDEIYNYSFYGTKEIENCLMEEKGHLKLLNYLSEDQTHLRKSMTPNILKNLQNNIKYFDEIKVYEIGRTYADIDEYFPLEEKKLICATLKKGKTNDTFYEAKGSMNAFLNKFNIKGIKEVNGVTATPYASPSKSLTYMTPDGQSIAKLFMLHPMVLKNHELEGYSLSILVINLSTAFSLENPTRKYKHLPKFPEITIDISVLIEKTIEIKTLESAISKAEKHLIKEVSLFDIYEGVNIPKNKKAIAFKITLQSNDRTLTDEDMSKTQSAIFKNLEALGGEIRGQ